MSSPSIRLGDSRSNPRAWPIRKFSSLVDEFRYGTSNKSDVSGLPTLRIPNVIGGVLDLGDLTCVPVSAADEARLRLKDDDLLFVRTNGNPDYVGRCAIFSEEAVRASGFPTDRFIYASYLIRARLRSDEVEAAFIREFMLSPAGRAQLKAYGNTSAGQYNITIEGLGSIQVPVPPIGDQRAIVDILQQTEDVRQSRRKSIALLDQLSQSMFFDMFGDVARNSLEWDDSQTLGQVSDIVSGITKGRKAEGPFERVPYLAVVNVQDMQLDLSAVKEIDATSTEIAKYRLKRNDLLLTEGGDPDKLGRGTLWQEELPLSIHQNHIFRVRLHDDAGIHPVFLNWLVGSERGRRYFLRSAKQTTGIASINATQLREFPLLVPPLNVQRAFSDRMVKLDAQKMAHETHLGGLDTLFASLQHRAFSGEL